VKAEKRSNQNRKESSQSLTKDEKEHQGERYVCPRCTLRRVEHREHDEMQIDA